MIKMKITRSGFNKDEFARKFEDELAKMIAATIKSMMGPNNKPENVAITVGEGIIKGRKESLMKISEEKLLEIVKEELEKAILEKNEAKASDARTHTFTVRVSTYDYPEGYLKKSQNIPENHKKAVEIRVDELASGPMADSNWSSGWLYTAETTEQALENTISGKWAEIGEKIKASFEQYRDKE